MLNYWGVNDRQLFLDFGEFVVIEFRYINNAGYIYSREYFDLAYNHKVLRNQVLKDGGIIKIEIEL